MTASHAPPTRPAARRVFIEASELPGLMRGVARGQPAALRRILGARRGGRYGVLLAAIGALAAASPGHWAGMALLHGLLCALGLPLARRRGLGARENQRLLLWSIGLALLIAAPARALGLVLDGPGFIVGALGILFGHGLHARNLRDGLEHAGEAAPEPAASE